MGNFFFPMGVPPILVGILSAIGDVWGKVWWIALPFICFFIFWDFWLLYLHFRFVTSIKWKLLEIKVPKNVLKTPKSMEQIFAAAHAPYSYGLRFTEKYWEGLEEYWMQFEIVGRAGETHFYLRVPQQFRNLMESAIYAQYPDAEISEVEDYVSQMPHVLPNKTFNLYGSELILKNPDYYPIRTYPMFEEAVDERRVDPMASIIEVSSRLKEDEQIWIQIMIKPTGDDWKKVGEAFVAQMLGLVEKKEKGTPWFPGLGISAGELLRAPFEHPSTEGKEKKKDTNLNFKMLMMTPGQKEIVEGIERKIAKLGFETTMRFLYIDKRETFKKDNVAAVTGFFRQFNTQNLNLIRPDKETMTAAVHGLFVQMRLNWRRRLIYDHYRDQVFNHHKTIFNIEELATIFHFPIIGVEGGKLEKVESRKGGPPAHLPLAE